MKKIFKKIGVLILSLAILSPYAELPVKAADNDSCNEHYLQTYLFLDTNDGSLWNHYTRENGYRTYTSFPYTFPDVSSNQYIRIDSVGIIPLDTVEKLQNYYGTMVNLENNDGHSDNIERDIKRFGYASELKFITDTVPYKTETYILHGYWSRYGENELHEAGWGKTTVTEEDETNFVNSTINKKILEANAAGKNIGIDALKSKIAGASYNEAMDSYRSTGSFDTPDKAVEFFQQVVDDVEKGSGVSYTKGYVTEFNSELFINLGIKREFDETNLNNMIFGGEYVRKDSAGNDLPKKLYVFSTKNDENDIQKSYTAYLNYKKLEDSEFDGSVPDCTAGPTNTGEPDTACYMVEVPDSTNHIDVREGQYLWPVSYNVEYSVCTKANSESKWKLSYDANAGSDLVSNLPDPDEEPVGESITVSDMKPKRTGWDFRGWCTKDNSYCPKAGDKVSNTEGAAEVVLYAQWGLEGTTENPPQGVVSYIIGFLTVGVVATGIYFIVKKKNQFKQI